MVDYLCLKLGKFTEEILDLPYFDCKRKFNTYRALDVFQQVQPIVAYPILSEEGGASAMERATAAQQELYKLIGMGVDMTVVNELEEQAKEKEILEQLIGEELFDIEDFIKDI